MTTALPTRDFMHLVSGNRYRAGSRHIRTQWREEERGPIVDRLDQFIEAKK